METDVTEDSGTLFLRLPRDVVGGTLRDAPSRSPGWSPHPYPESPTSTGRLVWGREKVGENGGSFLFQSPGKKESIVLEGSQIWHTTSVTNPVCPRVLTSVGNGEHREGLRPRPHYPTRRKTTPRSPLGGTSS